MKHLELDGKGRTAYVGDDGKHTVTSWWKSFNGPVASAISKIDNEIKQKNNLDLILKSSLGYIKNNQKKLKKKK